MPRHGEPLIYRRGVCHDPNAAVPQVTVVLPCLNEAESIAACINEARQGFRRAGVSGEVLVIDNGSADGSAALARSAGARVVAEPTRGYGNALRRGIAEAAGSVIVTADADCTNDLSRLGELVSPILDGSADLVLGRRFDGLNRGTMPLLHRLVGTPAISFALRRVCHGLRIRDCQTGYRAFSAPQVRALELRAAGMEFNPELLIRASQDGLRIEERQVGYRPRVGQSKLSTLTDGWRNLQLILLLAPQLLLFWPGAVFLGLGLILTVLSLVSPAGFGLGALNWQPVFLAPILVVLGSLGALSGAVVAYHSALSGPRASARFSFVGNGRFPGRCITVGALSFAAGMILEVILFTAWVTDGSSPSRALAMAGIAQALVITGLAVSAFGVLYRILIGHSAYRNGRGEGDVLPFATTAPLPLKASSSAARRG